MAKNSSRGVDDKPSDMNAAPKSRARRNGQAPRQVTAGDTAPAFGLEAIEQFEVAESVSAAQDSEVEAVNEHRHQHAAARRGFAGALAPGDHGRGIAR